MSYTPSDHDPQAGDERAEERAANESTRDAAETEGEAPNPPSAPPDEGPTIVGIGASAGGLAALRAFFREVPEDSGLAFVVVVHLSPEHESHLAELLQPHVKMPVQQVTEEMPLQPNCVYVIPPNANLSTIDTHLRLSGLEERRRERAPIDHFFRTLAQTHDGHAIAVVLTGTGSDGTLGIKEIKEKGGLTVVQDPNDAEYDGMPQSAVATGIVDLVLPLTAIPEAVLRYAHTRPRIEVPAEDEDLAITQRQLLQKVFAQLRARTGRDFSRYKRSTILRRIQRRMQLRQIEELPAYLDLLRQESDEVHDLADDLLITVTNFFRDPEVFEALEQEVIPTLFQKKGADDELRVWSVGCATGEEAYSLTILLLEAAARHAAPPRLQVFASDLHERSLQRARDGFYPGDIATDVSAERLGRFFHKEDGGYRIRKEVRELVVFAPHNLLSDPPFSKLDLVSCRNVMIYLQRDVQQEIIELFHYALRPGGYLALGTSETVDSAELFRAEDKKSCIYRKRNVPAPEPRLPVFPLVHRRLPKGPAEDEHVEDPVAYGMLHQRMVEQFAPPSALVSPDDKVVHLSEHAGRYFVHPGGELTASVFKLVREELRIELRSALHAAREERTVVRTKAIPVRFNGHARPVVLDVRPAPGRHQDGFCLIIFDEREPAARADEAEKQPGLDGAMRGAEGPAGLDAEHRELRTELDLSQQRLQAIIEEYETSQEELKASNEELQSSNEELRSTLEELETSKEELQSMNEELQTVNQENRHKVEELAQLSSDLQNLMAATEIATLFLDRELRIMRFTPRIGELFNVRPADRARPISDFTHRLGYTELEDDAQRALDRLVPMEREVQDEEGRWYLTRVLPYRSTNDRIEGVVITFVEITKRREAEDELRRSEQQFRALVDASAQMVWTTDADGHVVEDSPSWRAFTGQTFDEWKGVGWLDAVHPEDRDRAAAHWQESVTTREPFETEFRVYHTPSGDYRWTTVRAVPLCDDDDSVRGWVGMNTDTHENRQAEEALRQSEERFRTLFRESQDIILIAGDDGTLMDANPAAADILGYERDELLGHSIGDISAADEATFRAAWRTFLENGEMQGEYQLLTQQGKSVDMEFAAVANVLPGQHLSTLRDVTERKQTMEALRQSEERLRVALSAVNLGVWSFDVETGAASRSQRYYEIYGYAPPPDSGHLDDFYERVHPDDRARIRAAVEASLRDERPYRETFRIVRPDGEARWVHSEGRLVRDEEGEGALMTGVVQDITERREAEEALRRSEERYRLLVESATEYAILMLDTEGRVVSWNQGAERIFGYTEREILGQPAAITFSEEDRAASVPERELMTAARDGQAADDRWHVRKGGERFWANGVLTALRTDDGDLRGFAKVLRDNTERKQAEDELRWLNETLEARVRERTEQVRELASTLAMAEQDERRRIAQILHDDLQQLLFGIQLKMTFVRRDAEEAGQTDLAEHAAEADRFLDRAIHVTRQLTVDLSPPILAGEGLTHALEWLTTQMEEVHNLSVEVLAGQPFVVSSEGMRVLLFQVVRELLFNVVKHADTDRALVTLDDEDGTLVITVEDEGRGFDPDTLEPKTEGGFGLFSVRERLRLFGGHLEIDSTPGNGTRMTAVLPAILLPVEDD